MDRWRIYELLKGNNVPSDTELISEIGNTSDSEIREGLLEFLLCFKNNNSKNELISQIDNLKYGIYKELEKGNEVTLKNTAAGLKAVSSEITSYR